MARICHICNTLQISKYLKIGNFVKFLSVKIRISSKMCIQQDEDHSSKQLYTSEPDVQKIGHLSIFLLSFSFPRLTQDCLLRRKCDPDLFAIRRYVRRRNCWTIWMGGAGRSMGWVANGYIAGLVWEVWGWVANG